jgi:uncharacterized protein
MGHCDSSAQLGRDGGVFGSRDRVAGAAASHGKAGAIDAPAKWPKSFGAWTLLLFLRLYMVLLSPFVGGACKFHPSCSNYAYEAVARHGARRGGVLAIKRLLRCRPFTKGGFDPVPEEFPGLKPAPVDGANAAAGNANYTSSSEPASNLCGLERRL